MRIPVGPVSLGNAQLRSIRKQVDNVVGPATKSHNDVIARCVVGDSQVVPSDKESNKTSNQRTTCKNIRELH
jgi:hypothetical protein